MKLVDPCHSWAPLPEQFPQDSTQLLPRRPVANDNKAPKLCSLMAIFECSPHTKNATVEFLAGICSLPILAVVRIG
jgi:hypothetical protein